MHRGHHGYREEDVESLPPRKDERPPAKKSSGEETDGITLGSLLGSPTGEAEQAVVPAGWSGTEDATSTAPSDMMGLGVGPDGLPLEPDFEELGGVAAGFSELQETDVDDAEFLGTK